MQVERQEVVLLNLAYMKDCQTVTRLAVDRRNIVIPHRQTVLQLTNIDNQEIQLLLTVVPQVLHVQILHNARPVFLAIMANELRPTVPVTWATISNVVQGNALEGEPRVV